MLIVNRRKFIQTGSLASAAMMLPKFLKAFEKKKLEQEGKILVVVQLSGGNDGLNTVIPYRNDIYYKVRPELGIRRSDALAMTDELGLHPALKGLKSLYDDGSLGVLNNVGYPNPDRSHFRSMDIWQTASGADQLLTTGWIGRYLDAQCDGCGHTSGAIEVDDTLSLSLKGKNMRGLAVPDPQRLYASAHDGFFKSLVEDHHPQEHDHNVDYLYKTLSGTMSSADYIYKQSKIYKTTARYPDSAFGKGLKTIAELIISGCDTRVYYISLGSFDTHVNQHPQQQRLFTQLGDGLKIFSEDLRKNNRFKDVMVATFSEFGRRVAQNASQGTDHGTANCMFLVSEGMKKQGVLNQAPDLSHLDQNNPELGDLIYQVDFRDVYATLLHQWLHTDDKTVLGEKHKYLDFI
ncbi:MAG TPA: DUF1501 domain-containing protein [Chitinophagaceae bacterium]|jgi:uncharacterized protein (DUF1501 family)|nr:DUF1501 domain-containing protein [Chitinophagaceae bacterium]